MILTDEKLYFGLPIKLGKDCTLYQPKLKEVLYSDLSIELLIEPFITLDKNNFEEDKDNKKLKNFDMFFLQILVGYIDYIQKNKKEIEVLEWLNSEDSNNLVIKRLIKTFKFLFRTEEVQLFISDGILDELENNFILINKSYRIDRDTFDDIKEIVCEIFDTEIKIEKKKEVVKSEEEKRLDELFAKKMAEFEKKYGAKKEKNKDKMTIFTLVNYIVNSRYTQYDYNTIQELTIYQIKNTFKYYQSQEIYDIDMKYRTSGNFEIKKESEHWFFDK